MFRRRLDILGHVLSHPFSVDAETEELTQYLELAYRRQGPELPAGPERIEVLNCDVRDQFQPALRTEGLKVANVVAVFSLRRFLQPGSVILEGHYRGIHAALALFTPTLLDSSGVAWLSAGDRIGPLGVWSLFALGKPNSTRPVLRFEGMADTFSVNLPVTPYRALAFRVRGAFRPMRERDQVAAIKTQHWVSV